MVTLGFFRPMKGPAGSMLRACGAARPAGRGRRTAQTVLRQVLVSPLSPRRWRRRVRPLELRVDHRRGLERHRARDAGAVDEEVGGAVGAELGRLRLVVADHLGGLRRVQVALVLLHVQAQVLGHGVDLVLLERVGLVRGAGLEQLVVHLPELPLPLGGDAGLGRVRSVRCMGAGSA
jgi:hypothetical protein